LEKVSMALGVLEKVSMFAVFFVFGEGFDGSERNIY
jgi:hypothetical protein